LFRIIVSVDPSPLVKAILILFSPNLVMLTFVTSPGLTVNILLGLVLDEDTFTRVIEYS